MASATPGSDPLPARTSATPDLETHGAALAAGAAQLAAAGIDNGRLDAELLLAAALGVSRAGLLARLREPLTAEARDAFEALVARRTHREPLAFIVGGREFWSLWFELNPGTLIPRPETEILVAAVLDRLYQTPAPRVLDVGTGSGCIAIALASERRDAKLVGIDIASDALGAAQANAERLAVAERVAFVHCDLREAQFETPFDLVVSNLPYVRTWDLMHLEPEVAVWEPPLALDGGPDGLDLIRALLSRVPDFLRPGGWLLLEIGSDQGEGATELAHAAGLCDVRIIHDYAKLPRVLMARYVGAGGDSAAVGDAHPTPSAVGWAPPTKRHTSEDGKH